MHAFSAAALLTPSREPNRERFATHARAKSFPAAAGTTKTEVRREYKLRRWR